MKSYEEHVGRAREMLAQGFHTKQARKWAAEHATRAYEAVEREIRDKILALPRDADNKTRDDDLYWNFPACHALKEKHFKKFEHYKPELAKLLVCTALRAEIMAAPEAPKPKTKKEVEEEIRNAEAMTCQICGRKIYAELGVIAHHGYERPGQGWQTESCEGARELPFEVDRVVLEKYIAACKQRLSNMKQSRNHVNREIDPVLVSYEKRIPKEKWVNSWKPEYQTIHVVLTRATCEAAVAEHPILQQAHQYRDGKDYWEYFKARDLRQRDYQIHNLAEHIKWQTKRFAEWPGVTHRFEKGRNRLEGKWVKI